MSPEFLLTAFIIVASPGTGVVYTLAVALSQGARAAVRKGRRRGRRALSLAGWVYCGGRTPSLLT